MKIKEKNMIIFFSDSQEFDNLKNTYKHEIVQKGLTFSEE